MLCALLFSWLSFCGDEGPAVLTSALALERVRYQAVTINPQGDTVVAVLERPEAGGAPSVRFSIHELSTGKASRRDVAAGRYGYFRWNPAGSRLLFLHWGSGFTEVGLMEAPAFEIRRPLDPEDTQSAFDLMWPPSNCADDTEIWLLRAVRERGFQGSIVARFDLESGAHVADLCRIPRLFVKDVAWSHGGAALAFTAASVQSYGPEGGPLDLYVMELDGQPPLCCTRGDGIAARPVWSNDDSCVVYVWDRVPDLISGGRRELRVTARDGSGDRPLAETYRRSIGNGIFGADELLWISPDGASVRTATQQGLADHILEVSIEHGSWHWLTKGEVCFKQIAVADASARAVSVASGPRMSESLVVHDFERATWTALEQPNQALQSIGLAAAERRCWRGAGEVEMEGLLYLPAGAPPPLPLLMLLHGGSSGRHTLHFNDSYCQMFAARGYAVFMPNPRGSAGYDFDFSEANRGDFGGGEVDDLLAALSSLLAEDFVDARRCYVLGHSYGGYLAQMLTSHTGRFAAAASVAGVSDWFTLRSDSDLGQLAVVGLGDAPEKIPEKYRERSPLYRAGRMRTPLLLIHGDLDQRVPPSQSMRLFDRLREQGVDSRLLILEQQGHVVRDSGAIERWTLAVHEWFASHALPH